MFRSKLDLKSDFTPGPYEMSFRMHSTVKHIVKVRFMYVRMSVRKSGAP